jgi:hypothetical protein
MLEPVGGCAAPNSILFLGRPGVGKTTVIREMARVLADHLHKRVVIVDTSNEIGGDGDVPHPAIGGARRMQVPDPSQQHRLMVRPGQLFCLQVEEVGIPHLRGVDHVHGSKLLLGLPLQSLPEQSGRASYGDPWLTHRVTGLVPSTSFHLIFQAMG